MKKLVVAVFACLAIVSCVKKEKDRTCVCEVTENGTFKRNDTHTYPNLTKDDADVWCSRLETPIDSSSKEKYECKLK